MHIFGATIRDYNNINLMQFIALDDRCDANMIDFFVRIVLNMKKDELINDIDNGNALPFNTNGGNSSNGSNTNNSNDIDFQSDLSSDNDHSTQMVFQH